MLGMGSKHSCRTASQPPYGGNVVSYLADKIKATLLVQSRIAHHELCRLANLHFDTVLGTNEDGRVKGKRTKCGKSVHYSRVSC